MGMTVGLKPEKLEEYKELHKNVWPSVANMISKCNIRNYSIFHHDGRLFSYFEYTGSDFEADMQKMASDPTTKKWWELTAPMQVSLEEDKAVSTWSEMEEVFYLD